MTTDSKTKKGLYTLEKKGGSTEDKLSVLVKIDGNHEVFKGHFPEMPILPGVYIMQMVKDSLNRFLPGDFQLTKAGTVKFLKPVDPRENTELHLQIGWTEAGDTLNVSVVSYLKDESIHFKLKGAYIRR